VQESHGADAVVDVYAQLVSGSIDPAVGHVLSF
jgi:hypothetical protein